MTDIISNLKKGSSAPVPPEPRAQEGIMDGWKGDFDKPLVTIVCHTYNHMNYIKDTLNGFLIQETDFPFEIIIHDDASGDGTQEVLKEYAARYPSIIKLILQSVNQYSLGFRPPRLTFPAAKGDFIAFCEGDDYWIDPKKISQQTEFLLANKNYVITYTNSIPFDKSGILDVNFGGATHDLTEKELQRAPAIYTLTVCFRNLLDNPPEVNLARYGDMFIWSRLGLYGRGKYLGNIAPSMYRVHDAGMHSSASAQIKVEMLIQTYAALMAYHRRIGRGDLSDHFKNKMVTTALRPGGVDLTYLKPLVWLFTFLRKIFKIFSFLITK